MKVLFVCSGNSKEETYSLAHQKPFVYEQRMQLVKKGIDTDVFLIQGRGLIGYMSNLPILNKQIDMGGYDLVHAHYGLAGMFAVMQKRCPVVITFQGCDINRRGSRIISRIAMHYARHNVFVSRDLAFKARAKSRFSIIPYGVDCDTFMPGDKYECRKELNLDCNRYIVLFSSSFDRVEKNYPLARQAVELVGNVQLMELSKGYSREEVNKLFNACDLLLLTSLREGSPQVIKEAMACNCPIVSTDVGDVKELIGELHGCYISSFNPYDVAENIRNALTFGKRTSARDRVMQLDNAAISERIFTIYREILERP